MSIQTINDLVAVIKKTKTQPSEETVGFIRDSVENMVNEKGIVKFGGRTFNRNIDNIGNTIYEDNEGGKIDISHDGIRSFNGKNFKMYIHKNGNHNYIHKDDGLLFNEGNGFPNGVKLILTTIDREGKGKLIKFLVEKNGNKQPYYLNQEWKILNEEYNRIDSILTFHKDNEIMSMDENGVYSFNGKNFSPYTHKNGNQNYIHKDDGLLFNEKNGFHNGVKSILTTINHEKEGRLLEFTFIKNGTERTHYLNETGKILNEGFNRTYLVY